MDDERLAGYLTALFAPEDPPLRAMREGHESAGLPTIHVSPDEGKILHVLLRAIGARRVLEVGTLGGYSAVWMARALPSDGSVTTIERDPEHAAYARRGLERAGVADRVRIRTGEALTVLRTLKPPFDAVFLDADKAPLPQYLEEARRLVRLGGLILCDNTFLHGKVADPADTSPDTVGMRRFNELVAADPRLVAGVIPVRDGLLVAVKVDD
jgi:predicted O-methyltransferase YrrM